MTTETKTQHTPGPWKMGYFSGGSQYIDSPINVHLCSIYVKNGMSALTSEQYANAHLIAAAPDLLELLSSDLIGYLLDFWFLTNGKKKAMSFVLR